MKCDAHPAYVAAVRVRNGPTIKSTGSGVLLTPHHILTCVHVITNRPDNDQDHTLRQSLEQALPSGFDRHFAGAEIEVSIGFNDAQRQVWRRAVYLHEDTHMDLAVLKLDRPAHAIAAPFMGKAVEDTARISYFGVQNGRIARTEIVTASSGSRHFVDSENAEPAMIQHGLAAMAGYSGGPVIAEHQGLHHLIGIATIGGMGSPVGGFTTASVVRKFLERNGLWTAVARSLAVITAQSSDPPGLIPRFSIDMNGLDAIEFATTLLDDGHLIANATRPVSAKLQKQMAGDTVIRGSEFLPAHAATAASAVTLLANLASHADVPLRMPKLKELEHLRQILAAVEMPAFYGLPALLDDYAVTGGPRTHATWVEGHHGHPELAVFDGEISEAIDPENADLATWDTHHLRFCVWPMLALE